MILHGKGFAALARLAWLLAAGVVFSAAGAAPPAVPADHARQMAAGMEMFKQRVGAVLRDNCLECHGGGKTKGDFDLATREALLKGGTDGISVIPGKARDSKFMKLLRHEEEPYMPSKKPKLSDADIAAIAAWIDAGAPYDQPLVANAKVVKDRSVVTAQDRQFWSFQPLPPVKPPTVKTKAWVRTPVDQFILARLEAEKIKPNPPAEKRKLIRRAYLDLTGLPPTPEEVDAFVNDKDPKAYDKLIDRLLASPHYGERWARHWLDLARFGESHGYEQDYDRPFAYHYRDFVIRALNDDLPYADFVKWQIAGDELAPENPEAWMATGFLGAGTHATQITANQAEKERYDELDDIVQTIGTSMLGLTVGCARCHDHKFDPIPTQDYYRMISTFTGTVRSDKDIDLDPARTRRLQAEFASAHQPLVAARDTYEQEALPSRLNQWLKSSPSLPQPDWLWLELEGFKVSGGYYGINSSKRQADGSWLVSITAGSPDTMSFTAKTTVTNLTALRFEAMVDSTLPNNGPGWSKDGRFNVTQLTVTAKPIKGEGSPVTLNFTKRRTSNQPEGGAANGAWTPAKAGEDTVAVYELEKPVGFPGGTEFTFTLKFPNDFDRNLLGRVRVSATQRTAATLAGTLVAAKDFEKARDAMTKLVASAEGTNAQGSDAPPAPERKAGQPKTDRESLLRVFATTDSEWLKLNQAVLDHAKQEPRPQMAKALVCSEGLPAIRLHTQGPDFYENTYLLRRGDLAQKQNEAAPGYIQVLMRSPEQEKHWAIKPPADAHTPFQRAALANWMTDVDSGAGNLLARVIVNRLWQHHFGRGLVSTPSDFGATGERPTHPELLDWLTGELIRNGWHLKPIQKLIMTSAVYLQTGDTDAARTKVDPDNRLCWHRPPQRLEAEAIRDSILAVSGRLDAAMYGPGSLDEGMQRRSIYFFTKRSKLIPMMTQFDAPDSLQGLGRRVNTTVAPQALLLMNNTQVRKSAEAFAKRVAPKFEASPTTGITAVYRLAIGREPDKQELADATEFLRQQAATYNQTNARELALIDFCQVVLGLNEFIYVE